MCIIQKVLFIGVWRAAEQAAPSVASHSTTGSTVLRKLCVSSILQHDVFLTVQENKLLLCSVVFLMLTIPSISLTNTLNEHEQSITMDARLQRHGHKLCTPNYRLTYLLFFIK